MAEDRGPERRAELSEAPGPMVAHMARGTAVYDRPPFENGPRLLAPSELAGRDVILVRWIENQGLIKKGRA